MVAGGPHRPPPDLDLDRNESLLAARVALAEDHVWALREDPSYFAETILEMRQHRQELIPDVKGNVHPVLKPERENTLWARIIRNIVAEAYLHVDMFAELHSQAKRLQVIKAKFEKCIEPLQDLPEEYLGALLKFRHYLKQMTKGPMGQLKMTVVAAPKIRPYFARQVPNSPTTTMMFIQQNPQVKMDPVAFQLMWLLRTLWEDENDLFLCRLPTVVDQLDRYLDTESKAAALVSPYLSEIIGNLFFWRGVSEADIQLTTMSQRVRE